MPDEFVPLDTTLYTKFHRELAAKSIVIQQNLRYVDNNRKNLTARWTDFADFKQHFEVPQSLVDAIIAEGEKQHIKPKDEAELQKTIPYLSLQLKALIARDIWDMSAATLSKYIVTDHLQNRIPKLTCASASLLFISVSALFLYRY